MGGIRAIVATVVVSMSIFTTSTSAHTLPHHHTCIHDKILSTHPEMRQFVTGPSNGIDGDGARRRLRQLSASSPARLRIGVQYVSFTSDPNMDSTLQSFLQNTIVPTAVSRLETMLLFDSLVGPLYAHRDCASYDESFTPARCTQFATSTSCANGGEEVPITFTSAQFGADTYYSYNSATHRYDIENSLAAGTGFPGVDFVLFATAKQTSFCGVPSTGGAIAYALSCQRDGTTDRPTFGRANLCPEMMKQYYSDPETAIQVVMHEMLHALGFTSDSWPLFRFKDANGTPRTPRNALYPSYPADAYVAEYTCSGSTYGAYVPAGNTVQYFSERGMQTCSSPSGIYPPENCVARFVLPGAVAAAASFFNCSSLAGPELENQMTTECELLASHWEYRTLAGEMLTSFVTGMKQGFSAITLAVFEDSGWGYTANYSAAASFQHDADWGYKQGCAFATERCLSTSPDTGDVLAPGSPPHFSAVEITDESVCRLDRLGYGSVELQDFGSALPKQYQYFSSSSVGGTDYYGVPCHDYCPMIIFTGNERTCSDGHSVTEVRSLGMLPGSDSRCLTSSLRASTSSAVSRGVGCYQAICTTGTSVPGPASSQPPAMTITITAAGGGSRLSGVCTAAGQLLTFSGYTGTITCPDVVGICSPTKDLVGGSGVPASAYLPATQTPVPSPSPSPGPPSATPSPSLKAIVPPPRGDVAVSVCFQLSNGGGAPPVPTLLSTDFALALRCDIAAVVGSPTTVNNISLTGTYSLNSGPSIVSIIAPSSPLNALVDASVCSSQSGSRRVEQIVTSPASAIVASATSAPAATGKPPPRGPRKLSHGLTRKDKQGTIELKQQQPHAMRALGAAASTPSPSATSNADAACVAVIVHAASQSVGVTAAMVAATSVQASVLTLFAHGTAFIAPAFANSSIAGAAALSVPAGSLSARAGYAVVSATPTATPAGGGGGGNDGNAVPLSDALKYLLYAAVAATVLIIAIVVALHYSRSGLREEERRRQIEAQRMAADVAMAMAMQAQENAAAVQAMQQQQMQQQQQQQYAHYPGATYAAIPVSGPTDPNVPRGWLPVATVVPGTAPPSNVMPMSAPPGSAPMATGNESVPRGWSVDAVAAQQASTMGSRNGNRPTR